MVGKMKLSRLNHDVDEFFEGIHNCLKNCMMVHPNNLQKKIVFPLFSFAWKESETHH